MCDIYFYDGYSDRRWIGSIKKEKMMERIVSWIKMISPSYDVSHPIKYEENGGLTIFFNNPKQYFRVIYM